MEEEPDCNVREVIGVDDNAKMKKVTKPYFTAAMAKNGKDVEKWAGQMSQKTINNSPYAKRGKKK